MVSSLPSVSSKSVTSLKLRQDGLQQGTYAHGHRRRRVAPVASVGSVPWIFEEKNIHQDEGILGGGFKYFLFSTLLGKMNPF